MLDKNLFLYDLAVVAIMKGEEPYVKKWIDYHILAGVDYFYIYNNDSTALLKKNFATVHKRGNCNLNVLFR